VNIVVTYHPSVGAVEVNGRWIANDLDICQLHDWQCALATALAQVNAEIRRIDNIEAGRYGHKMLVAGLD
jgi:hypothetical protein